MCRLQRLTAAGRSNTVARWRAVLVLIVCLVPPCAVQAGETLRIVGASTILPVARDAARALSARTGQVFDVTGGGSDLGIAAAVTGKASIGMVSRALHDDEQAKLIGHLIGRDVVVPIVHVLNPVHNLSEAQLTDIYRGKVHNWKELGGSDRPLTVVAKKKGRSTREIWDRYFELDGSLTEAAHQTGANLASLLFVAADNSAIGYVSEGTVDDAIKRGIRVRQLSINGRAAGELRRADGRALARELNLVTRGTPSAAAQRFIAFIRSDAGLVILRRHGFVPASTVTKVPGP